MRNYVKNQELLNNMLGNVKNQELLNNMLRNVKNQELLTNGLNSCSHIVILYIFKSAQVSNHVKLLVFSACVILQLQFYLLNYMS